METFDQWLHRTGRDSRNIAAIELARDAWDAALAQSRNYVADDVETPEQVTFANGRRVKIVPNRTPGVHHGVYLDVSTI